MIYANFNSLSLKQRQVVTVLSGLTFLAGIYIEPTFLITGIALGLLVLGIGYLNQYLYAIIFPLILVAIVALFFTARRKIKKAVSTEKTTPKT